MLHFFRKIRWRLAQDNQFFKYTRYAIGEIVLVVLGILIALQINQWNDYRLKRNLETDFLNEIKGNLSKDKLQIDEILKFNEKKQAAIQDVMIRFEEAGKDSFDLNTFSNHMGILGSYEHFLPNRTAFDNLLDTESVSLISNRELRTLLSKYYKYDFEGGTQETIAYRTRSFSEMASSHLTTKESINLMYGVNLNLKSSANTQIHKDEDIITSMVYMSIVMSYQNELMTNTLADVNLILDRIEKHMADQE
ncbi:hypothetical protein LCM02_12480 [Lutimonas saemankumensis]|uniref:DUF6090 family protein n=1 Tax=Lutimonas saemankumensis TaxID=483016 RepID=UPI001CD4C3EA|nr:DUF6090 family protein [Lutimonas saemankumensis]MCA0933270.1 hypothetical protein [Lutimonas saemankumensis]